MQLDSHFPHCAPEDVGIDSGGIRKFIQTIQDKKIELHSFQLIRRERIAAQGWWAPYAPDMPHMLYSLSKSFTAAAVGIAIREGRFRLDDTVLSHFPAEAPSRPSENLRAMRVRDLLCMATGHDQEPRLFTLKSWEKAFLATPIPHRPGNYFLYNTPATYMLSSLVTRTTGEKLLDYLTPRLFAPLGIEEMTWDENAYGINTGGFGLNLRTADIAKFGQLLLQEGRWKEEQLIPRHWVHMMTAWQVDNALNREGDWAQGYGFQFWRCQNNLFRGDGMHGQFCIVMPEQEAVLAITAGTNNMQGVLDALHLHLLPAMKGSQLPPNTAESMALLRETALLALPRPTGFGKIISPALLGRQISFLTGGMSLSLRIEHRSDGLQIHLKTPLRLEIGTPGKARARMSKLTAGLGSFESGVLVLGNKGQPVSTSAAIGEDGSLVIHIQLLHTPYRLEIELREQDGRAQGRFCMHPNLSTDEWVNETEVQ